MVKAILNTKPDVWPAEPIDPEKPFKSMTRRIIKPRYRKDEIGFEISTRIATSERYVDIVDGEGSHTRRCSPPYEEGDVLWVRKIAVDDTQGGYLYRADPMYDDCGPGDFGWTWKSPRYMPREAARLFLKVKCLGVERLQDISEDNAVAEGFNDSNCMGCGACGGSDCWDPIKDFRRLWDILNAKRGYSWESNPWVWVYEFMRVENEHNKN